MATGAWDIVHHESLENGDNYLTIAGTAANDVWATFDKKLFHFDGKKLALPNPPAPIEFARLLPLLDDPTLRADVDDLLARKLVAPEKAPSAPMPRLHAFVASELDRLDSMVPPASRPDVLPALDAVFRELIAESWSAG